MNKEYVEKRLKTRTMPYHYKNDQTKKKQQSFKQQLDAIDISQRQCITDETENPEVEICGPYQECLFSQRGDIIKGKWGCYDSK